MAASPTGPDELAVVLLGGPVRYTRRQAAARAGVPLDQASKLWHALGFASVADDETAFTDSDVTALANAARLVAAGLVDEAALGTVTRMVGQTMSRLAEWQARMLLERSDVLAGDRLADFVAEFDPVLEQLQTHVWRRQLVDSAQRLIGGPAGVDPHSTPLNSTPLNSTPLTVGFADLAGYTALSRQLGIDELADVLERFEALVADLLTEYRGQVIKTIGDEVLFTVPEPVAAAALALRLQEQAAAAELPPLRIGLALGPVLARYGDVYGPVVNIASRLTGLARPGTVLLDQRLAEELADDPAWSIRRLRPASVRGYAHLHAARLRRSS